MEIMEFELSEIAPSSSSRRRVHWKSDVKQPAQDIFEPLSEVEKLEKERGTENERGTASLTADETNSEKLNVNEAFGLGNRQQKKVKTIASLFSPKNTQENFDFGQNKAVQQSKQSESEFKVSSEQNESNLKEDE